MNQMSRGNARLPPYNLPLTYMNKCSNITNRHSKSRLWPVSVYHMQSIGKDHLGYMLTSFFSPVHPSPFILFSPPNRSSFRFQETKLVPEGAILPIGCILFSIHNAQLSITNYHPFFSFILHHSSFFIPITLLVGPPSLRGTNIVPARYTDTRALPN